MKISFLPLLKEQVGQKVSEILGDNLDTDLIEKSGGSIGKAIKLQEKKEIYIGINKILENIERKDLIDILNESEILYKEKENIFEILEYIVTYLYNTKEIKKMKCIKQIEEIKKRIIANSNYDMCIDYLLIKIWEEINEKNSRSAF